MKIILTQEVEKLGYKDQVVEVAPGYANNFLIPRGMARAATASALKVLAENLRQQAHKEEKLIADARVAAAKLEAVSLSFEVKAEEGRIHGSITAADIAEQLGKKGVEVDRKSITVPSVKQTGDYEASVRIYKEVKATVKFAVVPDAESLARAAEAAAEAKAVKASRAARHEAEQAPAEEAAQAAPAAETAAEAAPEAPAAAAPEAEVAAVAEAPAEE